MSAKSMIWIGGTVGAIAGGYVPSLWGAGDFSGWGILLSTVGGIAGAIAAYKLARNYL
jgi:uncharacterized membrane protein YeaQ/YmgE (transglycosylase-associated protein family)